MAVFNILNKINIQELKSEVYRETYTHHLDVNKQGDEELENIDVKVGRLTPHFKDVL